MEAIIHFIFEVFKIAILSCFYATLILFIFLFIEKTFPKSIFSESSKNKLKIWIVSGFFVSIFLFAFMFTYWGNHGLGDFARIPIGYGKEVGEIDGVVAYIEPNDQVNVKSFTKQNEYLVGETNVNPVDKPKPYFCWNLKNNKIQFFENEMEYDAFAHQNNLPKNSNFKSFRENYNHYWNGWRLWLLP